MSTIDTLIAELTNDPEARGYAGMTDEEAAADLNTAYRTAEITTIAGSVLYNAIVDAEFDALDAAVQAQVQEIWRLGDAIQVGPGTKIRSVLVAAFPGGSQTRANVLAAVQQSISRAQELGLGIVKPGHVEEARRG